MTALLPPNMKVHLALGYIDMRKGIDGLAMLVRGVLRQDPFTGHLFVFRGPHQGEPDQGRILGVSSPSGSSTAFFWGHVAVFHSRAAVRHRCRRSSARHIISGSVKSGS